MGMEGVVAIGRSRSSSEACGCHGGRGSKRAFKELRSDHKGNFMP